MSDPQRESWTENFARINREYRRSRGWSDEPGTTSRISCELDRDLIVRLNKQARTTGIARQQLIATAIQALVEEFEQIDREETTDGDQAHPHPHQI